MNPVLYVLLVEDDLQACNEIENYIYSLEDIELVGITNNSSRALQIVLDTTPDAIILDLELHYGSGSGLSLLQSLQTEMVDKRPYVVVTTNNSSAITYEAARQFGADYIFAKHQEDYSSQNVVDFLRMLKNVIRKQRLRSMESTSPIESSEQIQKRITRKICAELNAIGISPKAAGYPYLVEAIQLAMKKNTPNLCNIIGGQYGKTASSVERAMQNAIAKAWRTTPIDTLLAFYTAKINSSKGAPTLTEFIYYYANRIKNSY